ncbi:MAG: hypothetical protein QOE76_75 [Frankiales bacterium]|nr:hypothetical protein [Frankiales bacterium]
MDALTPGQGPDTVDRSGPTAPTQRNTPIAQGQQGAPYAFTGGSLRGTGGGLAVGAANAKAAAQKVITLSGPGTVTGTVTVTGDTVSVKVTVARSTAILSMIGVHDLSQSATATATSVYGGTTQEGG